jgi:hypothetical protein
MQFGPMARFGFTRHGRDRLLQLPPSSAAVSAAGREHRHTGHTFRMASML